MAPTKLVLATAAIATLLGAGSAKAATELRYTCYEDGNECQVMSELLDRFESDNPDITVVVDVVPYKAILESLPVQLAYLDLAPYVDRAYIG